MDNWTMDEYKKFYDADPCRDIEPPLWHRLWGPEWQIWSGLLNLVFHSTRDVPREERDKLLETTKTEIIPIIKQHLDAVNSEPEEAFELFDKYHAPNKGVLDKLLKQYTALMEELKVRQPLLPLILENCIYKPTNHQTVCFTRPESELTVSLMNGPSYNMVGLENKALKVVNSHLVKKIALMEDQNRALAGALEKIGAQLPDEYATIQRQLDALKWSKPDEPAPGNIDKDVASELQSQRAQLESQNLKATEYRRELPNIELTSVLEDPDGSTISTVWKDLPHEMTRQELVDLLTCLWSSKCSEVFRSVVTEKEMPMYYDIVKEPRDLAIIKAKLSSDEPQHQEYGARDFFNDIRLMLDNESHFYGPNSYQYDMARDFEEELEQKLKNYGEAGQTAKAHFDCAPRAQFNDFIQEGNSISPSQQYDDGQSHYEPFPGAHGLVEQYGDEDGYDSQNSGGYSPHEQYTEEDGYASPYYGPEEQSVDEDGHETPSHAVHGQAEEDSDYDGYDNKSPGYPAPFQTNESEAEATDLEPVANPHAEQSAIDLTASPQRQPSQIGTGFSKRARASDDEESTADEEAPPRKRQKMMDESPSSPPGQSETELAIDPVLELPGAATHAAAFSNPSVATAESTESNVENASTPHASPRYYDVTPSATKRSRDDDDSDLEERERPSKRKRATLAPVPDHQTPASPVVTRSDNEPPSALQLPETSRPSTGPVSEPAMTLSAIIAAAVGVDGLRSPSPPIFQGIFDTPHSPPSPIPEPLTPVAAAVGVEGPGNVSPLHVADPSTSPEAAEPADGPSNTEGPQSSSPNAAAEESEPEPEPEPEIKAEPEVKAEPGVEPEPEPEAEPEPAAHALGHTENGTITASKLQKRAKWKKTASSKKRQPNRPWVFGYQFGEDYGLYIMSCPKGGCATSSEVFKNHPLMQNQAANHLQECGQDFADDDDMVRKFATQVISDDKKVVSIEWARNWNNELMNEYGDEDLAHENSF